MEIISKDGFLYKEMNGEIEVVGYTGSSEMVVVPNEIDGKRVVALGVSGCGNMEGVNVVIPDSVATIDLEALSNRHPVGYSGPDEFSWIYDLTVPDSNPYFVKVDGVLYRKDMKLAFFNFCYDAKKATIAEGTEVIGEYAFSRTFNRFMTPDLKSIKLPKSLKRIEKNAFIKCENLGSVVIPAGVEYIGDAAFSSKTKIKVSGDNTELGQNVAGSIEIKKSNKKYIVEDGCILSADKTRLLKKLESGFSFKVPKTVEQIDDEALGNCEIADIELNMGLKKIGHKVFVNSGVKEIKIPASVEYMEVDAFKSYFKMIKPILLEGNKRYYSDGTAIYHVEDDGSETVFIILNKSITQFVVPEKVKTLEANVFHGCDRLNKLILNEGLILFDEECVRTQLKDGAKFERIHIPSTVEKIKLIDRNDDAGGRLTYSISEDNNHYFIDDDILYEVNENEDYSVLFCQNSKIRHVVINEGTISISKNAFSSKSKPCECLTCIELPESLQIIDDYSFKNCKALTKVKIPSDVSSVAETAFLGCDSLVDISVSKNNEVYADIDGVLTSKDNTRLFIYPLGKKTEKYEMPDSVETFGQAFSETTAIKSLVLSKNIKSIERNAFIWKCTIESIYIQNDIKQIDECAFGLARENGYRSKTIEVFVSGDYYFCSYVKNDMKSPKDDVSIVDESETPEIKAYKKLFLFKDVEDGLCITQFLWNSYDKDGNRTVVIPGKLGDKPVVELGEDMFGQLSYGIETIIISEGIKRIGKSVLYGHSNLTKIVFPSSVEMIDPAVFSDDEGEYKDFYLKGSDLVIVVPSESYAETFIKEYKFEDESPRIVVDGDECPDYLNILKTKNGYKAVFQEGLEPTDRIIVPEKYKGKDICELVLVDDEWEELPEDLAAISLSAGVSKIIGLSYARFMNKCEDGTPSISVADGNKTFWSDGVALYSANKKHLIQLIDYTVEEYEVAFGVEVVDKCAFEMCSSIKKVILPSSIKTIEESAFSSCSNLIEIVGMDKVSNVGNGAIRGTALENNIEFVIVGNTLTKYNGKKKKAIIPEGVECISANAFNVYSYGETKDMLEEVVLPSTIKYIETNAFLGRSLLKRIDLPEGLLSIKKGAFSGCNSIASITVPNSVTEIEVGALPTGSGTALARITVAENNANYCAVDNVLYMKDMSEIVYVPYAAKIEEYIIPSSVNKVSSFSNENVSIIKIEGELESYSFDCESLKRVEFGERQLIVTGFSRCKNLCEVVWPKTVKEIGEGAFMGTSIKNVDLPETVEVIHTKAFANTKIKNFIVPKSVKYIGFEIVTGLLQTVTVFDNINADFFEYYKLIGRDTSRYSNSISLVGNIGGGGMNDSKWNAYRIVVKSADTDEVKFFIDMPSSDGSKGDFSGIKWKWTKGANFDFGKADSCFGEMKEVRQNYAISRLHMLDSLDDATREVFVKYLNRSAKAVICNLIDTKDLEELQYLTQFGLIKKNNVDEILAYAETKDVKEIISFLKQYKDDNFTGKKA